MTSLSPRLFYPLSIFVVVSILLSCVLLNNKLSSNFVDNILLLHSESVVLRRFDTVSADCISFKGIHL